jgi:sorbitol-specific phosphotransferase system component IIBC
MMRNTRNKETAVHEAAVQHGLMHNATEDETMEKEEEKKEKNKKEGKREKERKKEKMIDIFCSIGRWLGDEVNIMSSNEKEQVGI